MQEEMSQQIRVLRCFHCELFQTDIVKKSNKWQCKVCNSKQTVRKVYERGNGATCRKKAQELNMRSAGEQTLKNDILLDMLNDDDMEECDWEAIESMERNTNAEPENGFRPIEKNESSISKKSKWDCYT